MKVEESNILFFPLNLWLKIIFLIGPLYLFVYFIVDAEEQRSKTPNLIFTITSLGV